MSEGTPPKSAHPALAIPERQSILWLKIGQNINLLLKVLSLLAREEKIWGSQDHFQGNPNQKGHSKKRPQTKTRALGIMSHFHHSLTIMFKLADFHKHFCCLIL